MNFLLFLLTIFFCLETLNQFVNAYYLSKPPTAIFFKYPRYAKFYPGAPLVTEFRQHYFRPIRGYTNFNGIPNYVPQMFNPLELNHEQQFLDYEKLKANHKYAQVFPSALNIPYNQLVSNQLDYSVPDFKPEVQSYPSTFEIPYNQLITNHLDYSMPDVKPEVHSFPTTFDIPAYNQLITNHLDYGVSDVKPVKEHIEDDFKYDFRTKEHSYD